MNPARPEPAPMTYDSVIEPDPGSVAQRPQPLSVPPSPVLAVDATDAHAVIHGADMERARLLRRVARDRREVIDTARQLRGPVRTVQNAQRVLRFLAQALPWVVLAGSVAALAVWLRSDRRQVPKTLLLGLALQAYRAFNRDMKQTNPRTAIAPPGRA